MTKRNWNEEEQNEEEQEILLSNIYVQSCSEKYITFTDNFREKVGELHREGIYWKDIGREGGFPEWFLERNTLKQNIKNWKKKYKPEGKKGILGKKKGRKKQEKRDTSQMSKDEYIEYLEAKLALSEALQQWESGKYP